MGLFSNLFSSKLKDFSKIGADIHAHLIPGIDDGSKTLESSVRMIRGLEELGYKKLLATPHVMVDYYKNSTDTILRGLDELREELVKEGINIQVDAAAEYYADEEFAKRLADNDVLTFGDNYLLFEVSYVNRPNNLEQVIFDIKMKGYKPVIAHPERYTFMYDDFSKYEALYNYEVDFQINIASFAGHYSPAARKIAEKLAKEDKIHWLGTDIHHSRHLKIFQKAMESKYLKELVESDRLKNPGLLNH